MPAVGPHNPYQEGAAGTIHSERVRHTANMQERPATREFCVGSRELECELDCQ